MRSIKPPQPAILERAGPDLQYWLVRYGFAVAIVGLTTLISLLFKPVFEHAPFLLFWIPVILSTWFGNLGPGLLAALLTALVVNIFFQRPQSETAFSALNVIQLGIFALATVSISWLHERRRRAEEAIFQQGKWFHTTLSSIGDGVIVTDTRGCIVFFNTIAADLTGWMAEAAVGQDIHAVFHIVNEDTRQLVDNPVVRVLREGNIVGLANHTVLIARDGSERAIDDSGAPIRNALGDIIGVVLVFRDVTERRRQQLVLQEREERFRVLADTMPSLLYTTQPDGTCDYANQRFYEYSGLPHDAALTPGWVSIIHPDDLASLQEKWRQATKSGQPFEDKHRFRMADGTYHWFLGRVHPVHDVSGKVVQWIGTSTDIDAVTRAEQSLRKAEYQVRQQLAEIEAIYNTAPVGLGVLDRDLRFVRVNEQLARINGFSVDQHLGRTLAELVPALADTVEPMMRQVIETGEPVANLELRGETAAFPGVTRIWNECWLPLRDASGFITGLNVMVEEITERKRIQEAEREQRELAEALRDIGLGLSSTLNLPDVLELILASVENVVPYETVDLLLLDDQGMLTVAGSRGYRERGLADLLKNLRMDLANFPLLYQSTQTGQPVVVPDIRSEAEWKSVMDEEWRCSYLGIPILLREKVIGFLNLTSTECAFFTPAMVDRLQAFASHAALAVQNAWLYQQAQEAAAIHERERLARDLHDAVSQSLFSASTIAEALPRQFQRDPEKTLHLLEQIRQITRGAQAEMRTLLLELRPSALFDADLKTLLVQLAEAMRSRKRIDILVQVDDDIDLPPDVKISFYRIVQESLNNIVKHSQATKAEVRLHANGQQIELLISDNGQGFDLALVESTSLGLNIMRERAAAAQAALTISSAPDQGTLVRVHWPHPPK